MLIPCKRPKTRALIAMASVADRCRLSQSNSSPLHKSSSAAGASITISMKTKGSALRDGRQRQEKRHESERGAYSLPEYVSRDRREARAQAAPVTLARKPLIAGDPIPVVCQRGYQFGGKAGNTPPKNSSRMLGNLIPGVTPESYTQPVESGPLFGIRSCRDGATLV